MRSNPALFFAIFFGILFILDLYFFKGLRLLTNGMSNTGLKQFIHYGFIGLSILLYVLTAIAFTSGGNEGPNNKFAIFLFATIFMFYVPKFVFGVFHLLEDISYGIAWIAGPSPSSGDGEKISRFTFLSQTGMVLAAIPFTGIAYGILKGRFAYRVLKEKLVFSNLPEEFDGLKIVQISDIHIGSFFKNFEAVQPGFNMINELKPDLILFTGDLVNNVASEVEGWTDKLGQLKAKYGKYSILGNHDYGDYVQWSSAAEKAANMDQLKQYHKDSGFDLLLNENRKIDINGKPFPLIGVENWGKPPFVQYGDLKKALSGVESEPFKILMSHDPSHWDEQVLDTDIDVTLSGHTHGMQFGVEVGAIKWSPVKFKYPRWGGLYTEGKQHLYVNRGFGYIGFPGRVGMPPEITLIELKKA